jgi:hypothetical protein
MKDMERRNWRNLSKMALFQSGIFGVSTLPAFGAVSEVIGSNFSTDHLDLQTGAMQALPDEMAEVLLYGAPSQLVGLTTRGDTTPRVPNPLALDQLAIYNMTKQGFTFMGNMVDAVKRMDSSMGTAMLEAVSLQSINRPMARWAELGLGYSITNRREMVDADTGFQPDAAFFNAFEVSSRVLGTRPLEEIKTREALHLRSFYGTVDSDRRKKVTSELKSRIENNQMDAEAYGSLMEKYMKTGTVQGWRGAVRDAMVQSSSDGNEDIRATLKPDNPLNSMLEDVE